MVKKKSSEIQLKNRKKKLKWYPPQHIYMTGGFSGMAQAPEWKMADLNTR